MSLPLMWRAYKILEDDEEDYIYINRCGDDVGIMQRNRRERTAAEC